MKCPSAFRVRVFAWAESFSLISGPHCKFAAVVFAIASGERLRPMFDWIIFQTAGFGFPRRLAAAAACISGGHVRRPLNIADSFAHVSAECVRPFRLADIFRRVSSDALLPRRAAAIFSRFSADATLPFTFARQFAITSGLRGIPRNLLARFSTDSAVCTLPVFSFRAASINFARCSGESFLPLLACERRARTSGGGL